MRFNHAFKFGFVLFVLLIINENISKVSGRRWGERAVNGGANCAACAVIVGLIEELAVINNQTIEQSVYNFCNLFPKGLFRTTCQQAVDMFGPTIIDGLYSKKTPDVICLALKFCTVDKGQPECRIFPKPTSGRSLTEDANEFVHTLAKRGVEVRSGQSFCSYPVFKEICDYFEKAFRQHTADEDTDNDGYSMYETFRGTSWKGKDCNDFEPKIHPGTVPKGNDTYEDSNCNGIWGVDSNDGVPYEYKFCKNSQQRGIVSLGDSITAHFHLPEQWFDATTISEEAFQHIAFILENEIDWPQLSGSTGHIQNQWPVVQGNTSSLYLKLWERNKCNFRDYQNIGVNGADTVSMNNSIVDSISRNQNEDQPLIVLYSLVGNDVCNGDPDTVNHFTKPDDFYNAVVNTMQYLDTRLPNGSHVLLTGLANGSYLYGLLHDRIHPIGRFRNDVTYADFYDYLSCLQVSPCNGWMTTNDTLRVITTAYADMLSHIVRNVTVTHKFKNFDMAYMDFPLVQMIQAWVATGGQPWELIEPVDGFHINQLAHPFYADAIWQFISTNVPDWLGPINPFNDQITQIFADQGGY